MDLKTIALDSLKAAVQTFTQDLKALPPEAFNQCFGGKARTVADIVYEVNLVNDHVGMVIRGEEPFVWPDGWIRAPADFCTKEVIVHAFERSSQPILDTVEALSQEQLEETVQTEQGARTKFQRCQFMSWHMTYHSGQLNFIQTLLGDDNWHWR